MHEQVVANVFPSIPAVVLFLLLVVAFGAGVVLLVLRIVRLVAAPVRTPASWLEAGAGSAALGSVGLMFGPTFLYVLGLLLALAGFGMGYMAWQRGGGLVAMVAMVLGAGGALVFGPTLLAVEAGPTLGVPLLRRRGFGGGVTRRRSEVGVGGVGR